MKLKQAPVAPKGATQQTHIPSLSLVKLSHTQGMKQSKDYQTADVSYSVELFVKDTPKDIAAGITRCEEIVENALGEKIPQTQQLLDAIARRNR